MKAGYVQTAPHFGEKERNFDEVRDLTRGLKADLLVLPELFATGYTFASMNEVTNLAEPVGGPTTQFFREIAQNTGAVVCGGFAEEESGEFYNSAMLVSPEGVLGVYRKIHLFNREKEWFSSGDRAPFVIDAGGLRIGMMICFDWFFPEIARTLALKGAQVIAHPSNLVMPYCQQAMPTRCLENRVFAVTANRIGREKRGTDDFTFTGGSQVTAQNGMILLSAPLDRPHTEIVDIDPYLADDKRLNDFNDLLGDRRPNLYF
jgi:predicted amidohydrolase